MTTKTVSRDVEIDLDDFSTDELVEEIVGRGGADELSSYSEIKNERLLRHGIEDRDWAKIEEFARSNGIEFSEFMVRDRKSVV